MAVAFHPNYATNGYFYVKYKANDASCVISRFVKDASNPNLADINSESIIFSYPNNEGHEGGDLEFGKDRFLYTTTGDGAPGGRGSAGDEYGNAQNLRTVKGKMLRLDVDSPSHIPAANPFQTPNDSIPDEIIALGLRNPWKFSFDRLTGDVWIGDVGQDSYEEVDFVSFGNFENKNYGWSCYEGNMPHLSQNCPSITSNLVFPIITFDGYNFNGHLPASVTGGYVYRGSQYPALNGFYCYADYNSGKFWLLKRLSNGSISNDFKGVLMTNPTTFGEDNNGELYVATFDKIYQIVICGTEQNLALNSPITSSSNYMALNSIQSTAQISNLANVSFSANNKIELSPGFKTESGVVFNAQIAGCQ
ncbi:PQQ-dependent sugar dehydrogenase [Emticicia sp.]|uniref:PQQ-dependent sugar dehydrogenase n=1 Tax=Emticicia sp. TaxID=1930953 RepID=UPI00375246DC